MISERRVRRILQGYVLAHEYHHDLERERDRHFDTKAQLLALKHRFDKLCEHLGVDFEKLPERMIVVRNEKTK